MSTRRAFFVALVFSGGFLANDLGAQAKAKWLGARVTAGQSFDMGTSAAVQAVGTDGGIATVTTSPTGEGFYTAFQKWPHGRFHKSMSISTLVADPDPVSGYHVTRYNTTWLENGVQRDEHIMNTWGAHGVAFFPADSSPASAPGHKTIRVNGNVDVTGTLNSPALRDLEQRIAALEAQLKTR